MKRTLFQLLLLVLTVQAAEASLVALPQLVEVLGSIETFLDDGPSTFCGESGGKRLSQRGLGHFTSFILLMLVILENFSLSTGVDKCQILRCFRAELIPFLHFI